jgi:hypothetical protein
VLPGEAFCDECGASLSAAAPTVIPGVSNDAPTMFAPPPPSADTAPATGEPTVICAACGQPNLATDRFCDHCGAALAAPSASPADVPPVLPEPVAAPVTNGTAPDADMSNAATVTEPPADTALAEAPTAEQPMVPIVSSDAQAAYEAERQRLEDEIARQQQIISQLEPVQMALGAATPAGVAQSIEQARAAKANAEAALAALQPPAPAVDPAEIARLEGEIASQQQVISQLEPVQTALGAATPAGVAQSIEQARAAKAKAEAELAALTSGAPAPVAPAAAPELPAVPVNVAPATPPPPTPTPLETAISEPAREVAPPPPVPVAPITQEPAATAAPAPAAPAPRLVMDEGKDLLLPTDKPEIVVGREDPISGIFPEIDLTPYGGETGGVSRQHARLNQSAGQWTVTDLNSTNYTRVDGAKIEPNVATPLKDGVRLQFGRVAMTFRS